MTREPVGPIEGRRDRADEALEALEAIAQAATDALKSQDTVSLTRALEVIRACADGELGRGREQPSPL